MLTIKESNITIMVKDMDKAVDFYEKLGLQIKNRWGNHYAQLTATGITIGLHPTKENLSADAHISIGFMTDNLSDAKSLLEKNQIEYQSREEEGGSFLHFKDPDGTMLYFMQSKW